MIIAISASLVTCCMSINTADFLCQCIVNVLGIIILLVFILLWGFLEALSDECTEPEIVSPALGVLLYSLWIEFRTNERRRRKWKSLDYFGCPVLDCITTVSGVQSVLAECSLYICVHFILQDGNQ